MHQRLRHGLEHVLQGADAGEDHGDVEDHSEKPAQGDILQDGGQGHKEEAGTGAHVQPVGEAGGNDDQGRHHGGDGVKERRVLAHVHHVLLFREVSAVDDHAAAGDGEGEEGLAHGPDPDHGVLQSLPAGGEHETVALRRAGQEGHPRRQHQEDQEEEGHHHLVGLLDAVGPQEEGQEGAHHHDDVVGDHGVGRGGEGPEPLRGVRRQEGAEDGVHQGLQNVGHDDGVADGDAEGARERQPAQDAAGLAHGLAPGSPGVLIGPQGAGSRPAAHGELRRKAHIAEDGDEQEVDQKEGTTAVAAHLIGEAPDVGHTHRGTHRRQDEAPAAGKALGLRVLVHVVPSLRRDGPALSFP